MLIVRRVAASFSIDKGGAISKIPSNLADTDNLASSNLWRRL